MKKKEEKMENKKKKKMKKKNEKKTYTRGKGGKSKLPFALARTLRATSFPVKTTKKGEKPHHVTFGHFR